MKTYVSNWFSVLVAAILFCGAALAGESPSSPTPSSFAQTAQQCDKEIQTKISALQDQYLKELSAVKQTYQGLGDLDKVLAAKNEQERFTRSKTVAEDDLVEGPEELRELQEKYQAAIAQASRQVAQGYINRLLEAKKVLTREDKLSDAVVVQKQIEVLARKYLVDGEEPELVPVGSGVTGSAGTRKGLVLYFSFSDKDGKKVFSRAGGKAVEGKLIGDCSITPKGKKGSGLFMGANPSMFSFPDGNLPMGNEPRTVAIWFKTARRTHPQCIFSYGGYSTASLYHVQLYENDDVVTLGEYGNRWPRGRGHTNVTDGEWHHMAVVYDGDTTTTVYMDGEVDSSTRRIFSTSPKGIGTIGGEGAEYRFEGIADEFMIFKKALSGKEVKELYKSQK